MFDLHFRPLFSIITQRANKSQPSMSIEHLDESLRGTELLAMELAENYYDGSCFDIEGLDITNRRRLERTVFSQDYWDNRKEHPMTRKQGKVSKQDRAELLSHSRNILVLGAGCTFNSFENIPLAGKAIELIKKKVTIASLGADGDISFQYFLL